MPELTPPHLDLTFMTPLSQERADRLVAFLAEGLTGTVADLGCGWAELLLQTVAAAPRSRGLGIDLDAKAIAHGRHLAGQRGLGDRVELVAGPAEDALPASVDALICVGASQIWGAVEENQPLDYRAALRALRAVLPRGSRAVYGEGIWSTTPTPEAVAPLAGRLDEFVTLPELLEIAVETGFQPLLVNQASLDEWDEFEAGFCAAYVRWLVAHPADHPEAAEVRARVARQREAYFRGYRGVLGMAYVGLVAV